MVHESIETTENDDTILQLASRPGHERDATGELKQVGNVVGLSQGDKDGNLLETIRGPKLRKWVTDAVARNELKTNERGEKELKVDLSRGQNIKDDGLSETDLTSEEEQALLDLRDELKRTRNIILTFTNLKPATVLRLRGEGMRQKGTEMVTKGNMLKKQKKTKGKMETSETHLDLAP